MIYKTTKSQKESGRKLIKSRKLTITTMESTTAECAVLASWQLALTLQWQLTISLDLGPSVQQNNILISVKCFF